MIQEEFQTKRRKGGSRADPVAGREEREGGTKENERKGEGRVYLSNSNQYLRPCRSCSDNLGPSDASV